MFERKVVIVERVPAWVECGVCRGVGYEFHIKCVSCNDTGGSWHEAVILTRANPTEGEVMRLKCDRLENKLTWKEVIKSSFLVREWEVCGRCKGSILDCGTEKTQCSRCGLTGAEPGTAGPWRVL